MSKQLDIAAMLKLGLTLAAFSVAACVMLAFVYAGTQKVIAAKQLTDLEKSLEEVFHQADSFEPVSEIQSTDRTNVIESVYAALKDGEITGVVIKLSALSGYSGPVKVLAGVSADGIVTGVKIIEHSETPGLGANAASPSYFVDKKNGITFYGQFTGKSAGDPFEVNNDVTAVTASTITSRAVTGAVKTAVLSARSWFAGINSEGAPE